MSTPTVSFVGIVPVSDHDDANRLATAFGYQPENGNTFSIRLSSDGEHHTHSAFVQSATPGFVALMEAGALGQLPPLPWADFGLTAERVTQIMGGMVHDTKPLSELEASGQWLQDHLAEVCAGLDPQLAVLEVSE